MPQHKLFELHRDEDVSGVSGTGKIAVGAKLSSGECVVLWLTGRDPLDQSDSLVLWRNIDRLMEVHGYGGKTRLVWVNDLSAWDAGSFLQIGKWLERVLTTFKQDYV